MSPTGSSSTVCGNCGAELPNREEVRSPCPICGSMTRAFTENVQVTMHASAQVSLEHIHEFYKRNPKMLALVVALTILPSVVGLFFDIPKPLSFAISIYSGIATYLLGPDVEKTIREITRG